MFTLTPFRKPLYEPRKLFINSLQRPSVHEKVDTGVYIRAGTGACPDRAGTGVYIRAGTEVYPDRVGTGGCPYRAGTGGYPDRAGTGACPYRAGTGACPYRAGTGACPYFLWAIFWESISEIKGLRPVVLR